MSLKTERKNNYYHINSNYVNKVNHYSEIRKKGHFNFDILWVSLEIKWELDIELNTLEFKNNQGVYV